jgi:hypothetical protein
MWASLEHYRAAPNLEEAPVTSIAKILGIALFASTLGVAAGHAQVASIDFDHAINFYKFRSFSMDRIHATDPLVEQRIIVAIERDLKAAPMQEDAKGGDLIVTACEAALDKEECGSFYNDPASRDWKRGWGTGGFSETSPTVEVPAGTLVVDMYDRKTNKLVWRGMIAQPTDGSSGKNDQRMDKAVNSLLGKFPPKPVKGAK